MAEMDVKSGGGGKGKPKKQSTRVDLTPMVDLGFLLITFFMLTTTLQKPKAMDLNMPTDKIKPEDKANEVKESAALTFLLGKSNRVYVYEGLGSDPLKPPQLLVKNYTGKDNVRDIIMDKQNRIAADPQFKGDKHEMVVLIKPTTDATYKNMVDILDEMNINDVTRYAIIDISPVEKGFIDITEQANGVQ